MEQLPNFESKENQEAIIDRLIDTLAEKEGMNPEDIFSDIITFTKLSQEDEDAKFYLVELAEKIGISLEEMIAYGIKKAKEEFGLE